MEEMYPVYMKTAKLQKETGAIRSTHYALETEKIHAAMYESAKQSVKAGSDIKLSSDYICPIYGYTVEGEAPAKCPVCSTEVKGFKKFE